MAEQPSLTWLGNTLSPWFPDVETALTSPEGLLAAGGQLSPEWLLEGYRRGIFPWFSDGEPILWWSPDPRMVLFPHELKVRRSLAKRIRNGGFRVTLDHAFSEVIECCSTLHEGGTWITDAMRDAYQTLHQLGYGHSVEVWRGQTLVGGLYGVAVGKVFFGESMFSRENDSSKVALALLVEFLKARGFTLIDCQMHTSHLERLGARLISRRDFVALLDGAIDNDPVGISGQWHTTLMSPA